MSPPPNGSETDNWQEAEDEEDPYDWFLYDYALSRLRSEEERDAVRALAKAYGRAVKAGVVPVRWGLGIFGSSGSRSQETHSVEDLEESRDTGATGFEAEEV